MLSGCLRIIGGYPRKGALAVGSDADIVLLQPGIEKTIRAADLHETDYTPSEGHVMTAWPTTTILCSDIVMENSTFNGNLKHRQFPKRKVADEIRYRPAV